RRAARLTLPGSVCLMARFADGGRRGDAAGQRADDLQPDEKTLKAAARAYQKARRYEKRFDYANAAEWHQRAIRLGRESPDSYAQLGVCLTRIEDYKGAAEAYQRSIDADDAPLARFTAFASLLKRTGEPERAERIYRRAWERFPCGRLALELGRETQSSDVFRMMAGEGARAPELEALRHALGAREAREGDAIGMLARLAARPELSAYFWLYLYARLFRENFAAAALLAKRIAAEHVLAAAEDAPPQSVEELHLAVAAACYAERFDAGRAILDRFTAEQGAEENRAAALAVTLDLLVSEGRVDEARRLLADGGEAGDLAFQDMLRGKSCAIVGPAVTGVGAGAEIDAHDLVARTNVTDPALLENNRALAGARTDIVFYGTGYVRTRAQKILDYLAANPAKLIVLRHPSTRRRFAKSLPDQPSRLWASLKKRDFIGHGFALRHILHDLVLHADRPVSVYGADFYLGDQPHYAGYFDGEFDLWFEYARHDVFDTFMFMKRLAEAGHIRCDPVLQAILSEDIENFASRISRRLQDDGAERKVA
ncbi:hypothetical protein ACIKTA_13345, partial [Hansschlegelia beijingensis]